MRLRLTVAVLFIAAAVSAAPLSIPPVQYVHRTLPNGGESSPLTLTNELSQAAPVSSEAPRSA